MANGEPAATSLQTVDLKPRDIRELELVADAILEANLERYHVFTDADDGKVDTKAWKFIKTKDQIKVYTKRRHNQRRPRPKESPIGEGDAELQSILCSGSTPGTLDDVMLGILNPTLESAKTSFLDDRSASTAVLSIAKEPTLNDPFQSIAVNWMELDVRRRSIGLVKNRDYVYVEATGMKVLSNGGRLGYRLMHSVDLPQAHVLDGRVRAKLSVCCFYRQETESSVSVYILGMMDAMTDRVRRVVVPRFVQKLLLPLKYAHFVEMKKLTQALGDRYAQLKTVKSRGLDHKCAACEKRLGRLGKFVGHHSTCKLCFKYVCNVCKVDKDMSFVTLDLKMTHRKVTFCPSCVTDATVASIPELPFTESRVPNDLRRHNSVRSSISSGWGTMMEEDPQPVMI
uniref:FYVE-type domain-containing protein n=1 Tax=Peronospora matthiolae TaxID=2874970 RepID=A0AAV1UUD5_9STRA